MTVAECKTADDVRRLARALAGVPTVPIVRLAAVSQPATSFMSYAGSASASFGPFATLAEDHPQRGVRVADIVRACVAYYRIPETDIRSRRQDAQIVHARHMAMYLSRKLTTRSLPEIGRLLSGRNHATVCHGVKRIEAMIAARPDVALAASSITEMVRAKA